MTNLLKYKYRVWGLIESFKAFNITPLPREENKLVDLLATLAANLVPVSRTKWKEFTIEMVPCPSVPSNVENFQAFANDVHILQFMNGTGAFEAQHVEEKENPLGQESLRAEPTLEKIEGIMSPRDNKIPKGMVALERMFDLDLPPKELQETSTKGPGVVPLNLGTPKHPQEVYIGSSYTLRE